MHFNNGIFCKKKKILIILIFRFHYTQLNVFGKVFILQPFQLTLKRFIP